MFPKVAQFYEFADFRLDVSQKVLRRGDETLAITPKVFDTLEFLLENAGRLLEKDELMRKIRQDRFVEESNLTSNIKTLRKMLGDDAAYPRFIETVLRRGYRFIAEVKTFGELPDKTTVKPFLPPRRPYMLISIAVVSLICIFGIAFVWVGGNRLLKNRQPKFTRLTTNGNLQKLENIAAKLIGSFAWSPDSKHLVFSQIFEKSDIVRSKILSTAESCVKRFKNL